MNDLSQYRARREALAQRMRERGGGIAIVPTAPEVMRSRDSEYDYRPDSYFWYLSGFTEPEAVLVLIAELNKELGVTILMATHAEDVAADPADFPQIDCEGRRLIGQEDIQPHITAGEHRPIAGNGTAGCRQICQHAFADKRGAAEYDGKGDGKAIGGSYLLFASHACPGSIGRSVAGLANARLSPGGGAMASWPVIRRSVPVARDVREHPVSSVSALRFGCRVGGC